MMRLGVTVMSNSSLVDVAVPSPNHSGKRTSKIERITPHCVVGQLTAESIGNCFKTASKKASCNYGIGSDGKVVIVVDEANRSWCSSNATNDQKAITIECASDKTAPYAMTDTVYNKLIDLIVDVCERNGIKQLLFLGDKEKTLAYKVKDGEAVLTAHRWFAKKSCPGDWLYNRYAEIADTVTKRLKKAAEPPKATNTPPKTNNGPETAKKKENGHSKGTLLTVTANGGLNIRTGAGSNKPLAGTPIPKGKQVKWYGYYTDVNNQRWLLVDYNGTNGYCLSTYLS